jgi:hypothetical protein
MLKRHSGRTYVFAVDMRDGETTARLTVSRQGDARVEVLGKGRSTNSLGGLWDDRFTGYQVHLYRIGPHR